MAEAAVGKRIKISKMQQHMMLAVLGTSLIFGISVVFSIYFIKYIIFNSKVIDAKDEAVSKYYKAIANAGVCKSKTKYSEKDLKECKPNEIDVTELKGTLRYNTLIGMTTNNELESVARSDLDYCYSEKGKKLDFTESYRAAKDDAERKAELEKIKACSSLRVVPDALPAQKNDAALLSSVNKIFIESGLVHQGLAPNNNIIPSPVEGLQIIPISLVVEESVTDTTRLLQNFEKSIRAFSFKSAVMSWYQMPDGSEALKLSASALAFYTDKVKASTSTKTIYATREAKTKSGNNSALNSGGE